MTLAGLNADLLSVCVWLDYTLESRDTLDFAASSQQCPDYSTLSPGSFQDDEPEEDVELTTAWMFWGWFAASASHSL